MPYVLYLIITSAFSWDFYICFIFQYYECLIMFFTPYNFTSIFLTIKGPVSQETVLVLFHRRYPTVPILLSSKIPFVLSDCVMFMWSITIHVLCMTHESTATPFCVNKNLYICNLCFAMPNFEGWCCHIQVGNFFSNFTGRSMYNWQFLIVNFIEYKQTQLSTQPHIHIFHVFYLISSNTQSLVWTK